MMAFALAAGCGSEEPETLFSATDPAGPFFEPGRVIEVTILAHRGCETVGLAPQHLARSASQK